MFEGDTFVRRGRGRLPTDNAEELVSVRLDRDVLAKLREAGPGWQSRVNAMLRTALELNGKVAVSADAVVVRSASTTGSGTYIKTIGAHVEPSPVSGNYVQRGPRVDKKRA